MTHSPTASAAAVPSRRARAIHWLRKAHSWIGLWGATLGLLFGTTGIFLNHRAVLKLPVAAPLETSMQLQLPDNAPADAEAMARFVGEQLRFDKPASKVKTEPARTVAWGDATLRQPAKWSASFTSPQIGVQAEYWVGNHFIDIKRTDHTFLGTLQNMHKGTGMSMGWILLVDSLAGSIILLSISGVLMWTLMHRNRRAVGALIAGAAAIALVAVAGQSF